MKVLILTTIMAPYRVNLYKELGKYVDLTVCFETQNESSRNESWFEKNTQNFKFVGLKNWDDRKKKLKYDIFTYLKKGAFDYVMFFEYSTKTSFMAISYCILKKIPYLINCDGAFIHSHPIKNLVKRFLISNARACLANGESAKKYFLHYGASEKVVFKHEFSSLYASEIQQQPLTAAEKKDLKRSLDLPDRKIVISVGQFIDRKGFDILLSAWKQVSKDNFLLIIGEGEKEKEYLDYIKSNQLENIKILGFKKKEELMAYYKASDLFVLATREDIWGLVINEAMACALPIITTDKCIAGVELVENSVNGYLVQSEDQEDLAVKIDCLLKDDALMQEMAIRNLTKIRRYTYEDNARSNYETLKLLSDNE